MAGWMADWLVQFPDPHWMVVGLHLIYRLSSLFASLRGGLSLGYVLRPLPLSLSVYLTVMTLMFVFVSKFNNNKNDHTINKSFDIVCLSCLSVRPSVRASFQPTACLSVRLFNPEMRMTTMTLRRMTTITTTWDFLVISINLTKPLTWGFALAHPHSWSSVLLVAF